MRRSIILDFALRTLFPSILVLSLYFLFAGHNQPGGGFAGGLVAGAGIALRYVAGGVDSVRQVTRLRAWTVAGIGLTIAVLTATVPMLVGQQVLEHDDVSVEVPLLGTLKTTTALIFDVGVYVLVVGVVLLVFEAFGEHPEERT